MGNRSLFPGVAVPLAFFCTLFFRHRKKSVSVPWDGKSQSAPESARQAPPGQGYAPAGALGAFRSPPVPFGSPLETIERPIGLQALLPRRSRRVRPYQKGISCGKVVSCHASRVAFRSPPCTPFGESAYQWDRGFTPAGALMVFPRGKPSARPAPPRATRLRLIKP